MGDSGESKVALRNKAERAEAEARVAEAEAQTAEAQARKVEAQARQRSMDPLNGEGAQDQMALREITPAEFGADVGASIERFIDVRLANERAENAALRNELEITHKAYQELQERFEAAIAREEAWGGNFQDGLKKVEALARHFGILPPEPPEAEETRPTE